MSIRLNYGCPITEGCTGHEGHEGKCSEKVSAEHTPAPRFGKAVEENDSEKETPRDAHKRGRDSR